ncbi:Adhesion G protein-coupled receptor L3 [Halotydeus destructor]|nr:Adhesion G protein-coupled receptor L3 [Halotydeus destructor]
MSHRSFKVIQEACVNKRTCTLPASSGYFGDPCPGTYKYLEAHYQCSPSSGVAGRDRGAMEASQRRPPLVTPSPPLISPHHRHIGRPSPPHGEGPGDGHHRLRPAAPSSSPAFASAGNTPPPIVIPSPTLDGQSSLQSRNIMVHLPKPANQSNVPQANHKAASMDRNDRGRGGGEGEDEETGRDGQAAFQAVLGAPQSTASSPTIITIVSEEKEIYVRHPWPKPQKPTNETEIASSLPSLLSEGPSTGNPMRVNSEAVGPNNEGPPLLQVPTGPSLSLLHDHCPPTYSGGLSWNWTQVGQMAFLPCPADARGTVRWFCSQNGDAVEWIPSHRPDFSDCSSLWVSEIVDRINKAESFVNIANQLAEITQDNRPETAPRIFFGGDLFRATDIINQLVIRMEEAFELFADDRQKNQMAKDMLQSIQDTASNMVEDSNSEAWFELPPIERKGAASSLMYGLERNVLSLSETKNIPSDFVRAHNNIYVSIHVRETASSQGTSAYSHRQGLELPVLVNEGVTETLESGSMPTGNTFPETSVYLLPQTMADFSRDGLTKVVLLMFKKLDRLLQPEDMSYISDETSLGSEVRRKTVINSDIVTVLMSKEDRFNSLTLEGPGILINFKHKVEASNNFSNVRCAYWNANQRNWETNGCSMKKTDSLHTICECNHLSSFALLMDLVQSTEDSESSQQLNISKLNSTIALGSCLSVICFALALVILIFSVSKNKQLNLKPQLRTELEVRKNLTLCLLVIEIIFLLGVNQTWSRPLCGLVAAFLHFFFLSLFIWLFFDGFSLYLAVISGSNDHQDGQSSPPYPTIAGFSVIRNTRPSKWYYVLSYGFPMAILTISILIDPSSYGTSHHCWLRSDNYSVLSFVGPMIAIVSANFLFLAITVCIICRNCLSALLPEGQGNLNNFQDTMSSANRGHSAAKMDKYNSLKSRMRESALLLFIVSLNWSLGVIYLNQSPLDLRGEDVVGRNACFVFAILNPIHSVLVSAFFVFGQSSSRTKCCQLVSKISCVSKCFQQMGSESGSQNGQDQDGHFKEGGSSSSNQSETGKDELVARPIIPPPLASPGMNQAGALMASKYYLPDGRMSEYGFRMQSTLQRLHPQLQQCNTNQLYSPSARLIQHQLAGSSLIGKNGLCVQSGPGFPQVIEHVYECIDEDPYVAQLLLHNPEQMSHLQGQYGLSFPTTSGGGSSLPAIIRDNTNHSIIVCRSRPLAGMQSVQNVVRGSQVDLKSPMNEQMLINMHESTLI